MSTATIEARRPGQTTKPRAAANGKPAPAKKDPAPAKTEAPKSKPETKPGHVTTRKGIDGQVCLGVCGKWRPLTDYGKTSKARGGKPMRRCRACITAEAQARKAAAAAKTETPAAKPKAAEKPKAKPEPKAAAK